MAGQARGSKAGGVQAVSRFDAFRLARVRESLSGTVDASTLPRLADRLSDEPAPIVWRIEGTADAMGRPALTVELAGSVTLECQRCLGPVAWSIDQRTELLLARDDGEAARLDEDSESEVLIATMPVDTETLIEDELVLALPFVARHPDGTCAPPT